MYVIFRTILFLLFLQSNQMFQIMALELDSDELVSDDNDELLEQFMQNSDSAHWPLQAGYPGLSVKNLNEYVSLFSHCLVNIQNYQGIEIIGIQSPVYITRFDAALLEVCDDFTDLLGTYTTQKFFFGRIPPKFERNCTTDYIEAVKYADKSMNARWYCRAQFDLFFPEPKEAPHIVHHSQTSITGNLIDVAFKYTPYLSAVREGRGKIL